MSNSRLTQLETDSITIIRAAFEQLKPMAVLWSLGKDSNVMLWLARKAFFGRVPFPVILLDTEDELPEVYAFRDEYVKKWQLDYITAICPPLEQTDPSLPLKARLAARKSLGLKQILQCHGFMGIGLGIRRDEQSIRAKERVFSPRDATGNWVAENQPLEFPDHYSTWVPPGGHMRVHPILAWTELDIWLYIQQENIPVVPLYFARDGKRYRSLGEKSITHPVASSAATLDAIIAELQATTVPERAGRSMDNETESAFETLRRTGYM